MVRASAWRVNTTSDFPESARGSAAANNLRRDDNRRHGDILRACPRPVLASQSCLPDSVFLEATMPRGKQRQVKLLTFFMTLG